MNDYSKLKQGDIFTLEGEDTEYTVASVSSTPGGGMGQGAYPPTWIFQTDKGSFRYDPWCSHLYRGYKVVGAVDINVAVGQIDIYNDEHREVRKKQAARRIEKEESEKKAESLRQEAYDNMTPEQRAAFGRD